MPKYNNNYYQNLLVLVVINLLIAATNASYSEPKTKSCGCCSSVEALEGCAMDVVLNNIRNETIFDSNSSSSAYYQYYYVAPCSGLHHIQESTSALLAARALTKYYNGNSSLAWQIIHSIFDVQGTNGFIPKYRYSPLLSSSQEKEKGYGDNDDSNNTCYIPDTKFPYKGFFQKLANNNNTYASYYPNNNNNDNNKNKISGKISSSVPLAALPLHSTIILEIFYLSSQTDDDLLQLELYFTKLFRWHTFLYSYRNISNNNNVVGIHHPWESTIPMQSPFWEYVLKSIVDNNNNTRINWTVPFPIPNSVKSSIDYPGDDMYDLFLYLFHCNANANNNNNSKKTNPSMTPCFTMVDLGYSSILAKSNRDLLQIAHILNDKRCARTITTQEWDTVYQWVVQSTPLVEENAWNSQQLSFTSQILLPPTTHDNDLPMSTPTTATDLVQHPINNNNIIILTNSNNNILDYTTSSSIYYTDGEPPTSKVLLKKDNRDHVAQVTMEGLTNNSTELKHIPFPVADNFLVFYGIQITNTTKTDYMVFHLVQEEGCFSFHIGGKYYPILPVGTTQCTPSLLDYNNKSDLSLISIWPTLNYWVSKGLIWNEEHGLGHYILNSTLKLICQLPKTSSDIFGDNNTCGNWNNTFAEFYNGLSGEPLLASHNESTSSCCEAKWTETAAIVYEMLRPDKNFTYSSAPPISSGWIFLFMTIELGLTLSVGVGCFLFSFNLRRRLSAEAEDGDSFARLMTIQGEDEWHENSLSDLYGEAYDPKTTVEEEEHHPGYLTELYEEQYRTLIQQKDSN